MTLYIIDKKVDKFKIFSITIIITITIITYIFTNFFINFIYLSLKTFYIILIMIKNCLKLFDLLLVKNLINLDYLKLLLLLPLLLLLL